MLLHGYLSSKEAFTAQVAYFSRFYRVTAFDFLGQGKSGEIPSPFSVTDYAEWTEELLAVLGVKNPCVIAHSFGCRVLVKMAARGKIRLGKLVMTGPAGVVFPRNAKYRRRVRAYRFFKRFAPAFAEKHFGSKEYRSLSPMMRESYKKIVNEDLRADARQIGNRILILQGSEDCTTTRAEAEAYLRCFERGSMKIVEGGHFAFVENALQFNMWAEEFFSNG